MAKKTTGTNVGSMPTWVQGLLLGVPAAVAMEVIVMVETDAPRSAVWYRATDVASDTVVAMGQMPWRPWRTPADISADAATTIENVLSDLLEPF